MLRNSLFKMNRTLFFKTPFTSRHFGMRPSGEMIDHIIADFEQKQSELMRNYLSQTIKFNSTPLHRLSFAELNELFKINMHHTNDNHEFKKKITELQQQKVELKIKLELDLYGVTVDQAILYLNEKHEMAYNYEKKDNDTIIDEYWAKKQIDELENMDDATREERNKMIQYLESFSPRPEYSYFNNKDLKISYDYAIKKNQILLARQYIDDCLLNEFYPADTSDETWLEVYERFVETNKENAFQSKPKI